MRTRPEGSGARLDGPISLSVGDTELGDSFIAGHCRFSSLAIATVLASIGHFYTIELDFKLNLKVRPYAYKAQGHALTPMLDDRLGFCRFHWPLWACSIPHSSSEGSISARLESPAPRSRPYPRGFAAPLLDPGETSRQALCGRLRTLSPPTHRAQPH